MSSFSYFLPAILALTVAFGGAIALKLHRPAILGYALAGIVLAFFLPRSSLISNIPMLATFAQIEAGILMFWAGMEFRCRRIAELKWLAVVAGVLGTLFSMILGVAAAHWLGWQAAQGVFVGAAIALSSTTILSRLATTPEEMRSTTGKMRMAVTSVQELVLIPIAMVLSSLKDLGAIFTQPLGRIALQLGKGTFIVAAVLVLAVWILPRIGTRSGTGRDRELYIIGAIACGFVTAALSQAVGLWLPLAAFAGGIVTGSFESAQAVTVRLLPLRNVCLALFLVTVSALVDPYRLIANPWPLLMVLVLIVVGKTLVWTILLRLLRQPFWTAAAVGIGLTQLSEFSYVVLRAAYGEGLVAIDFYNASLAALVLTIASSVFLSTLLGRRADFEIQQPANS